MPDKTEKKMISYQQVYMMLTAAMPVVFKDWPLGYPPNLIVHHNEPDSVKADPRGSCQLMSMRAKALSYVEPSQFAPISSNVHVFHPNILKIIGKTFCNNITHRAIVFSLMFSMCHELFHLINLQRAYQRYFDDYDIDELYDFSAELTVRHLDQVLGSKPEEQLTEHLASSAMLAYWFEREKLRIDDLYDGKLFLPKIDGPFFQQLRAQAKPNSCKHECLTIFEYRHHLDRRAWSSDPAVRQYHEDKADEMIIELQRIAIARGEKYGKTHTLIDEDE